MEGAWSVTAHIMDHIMSPNCHNQHNTQLALLKPKQWSCFHGHVPQWVMKSNVFSSNLSVNNFDAASDLQATKIRKSSFCRPCMMTHCLFPAPSCTDIISRSFVMTVYAVFDVGIESPACFVCPLMIGQDERHYVNSYFQMKRCRIINAGVLCGR